MPLDLNCPKCKHVFPVTEARHPVGVQCPGCEAELTAEFRKLPAPPPGESPYELLVTVGRPPGSPPVPASKPMKLDDDEEKERRGGSMMMVVVVGLGALLVTLGGLGATGYYLFTNLDIEETASTPNRNNQNRPNLNNPTPGRPNSNPTPASEFISREYKFSARFPGRPTEQTQAGPGGTTIRMFGTESGDGSFSVSVADLALADKLTQIQIDAALDQARDNLIRSLNGRLSISNRISISQGGRRYSGREFNAPFSQPQPGQVYAKIFLVGKRQYTVMVVGTNQFATSSEAEAFLSSFQLIN